MSKPRSPRADGGRSTHLLAALLCAGLGTGPFSGCAIADSDVPLATARDSAGVRIVEHPAGAFERASEWRLADQPELDIGVLQGEEPYQLYRVRSAYRLADGGVAVSNMGSGEIRFFDASGGFLRAVGGEGDGPTEFRSPVLVRAGPADSLLVFDSRLNRISVLAPGGDVVRTARITEGLANIDFVGMMGTAHVLVADSRLAIPSTPGAFEKSYLELYQYDVTGRRTASLGTYPFSELGIIGNPDDGFVGPRDFSARTVTATAGDRFWMGYGDAPELGQYDASGTLRRIIRWAESPTPVTQAHRDSIFERRVASARDEGAVRATRRRFQDWPSMEVFPPHGRLEVDRAGRVWIEDYVPDYRFDSQRSGWTILQPDGEAVVARISLPPKLIMLDLGEDWILGVETDDLEVEHVRLYRIER